MPAKPPTPVTNLALQDAIIKGMAKAEQSVKVSTFLTIYRQVSNIRHTLVGNKIVNHSNVVGALPVGAATTTFSFLT